MNPAPRSAELSIRQSSAQFATKPVCVREMALRLLFATPARVTPSSNISCWSLQGTRCTSKLARERGLSRERMAFRASGTGTSVL
jgi:hypothetical protein